MHDENQSQFHSTIFPPKLAAALSKVQGSIEAAEKSQVNDHFSKAGKKSTYADIADVITAVKSLARENGLSVLFNYKSEIKDHFIRYILVHESGEYYQGDWVHMLMRENSQHQWGGANTYYRRQLLKGIYQIPEEDDDGNSNSVDDNGKKVDVKPTTTNKQKQVTPPKAPQQQVLKGETNQSLHSATMVNAASKPTAAELHSLSTAADESGWPLESVRAFCLRRRKMLPSDLPKDLFSKLLDHVSRTPYIDVELELEGIFNSLTADEKKTLGVKS